jgi:hypothetical protein
LADLGPFYETTATLSPILLAGTALAFSVRGAPTTRVGQLAVGLFVLGPPTVVTWASVHVLAGYSSPEEWRGPVLILLAVQMFTGLAGTAGFALPGKEDRAVLADLRRERREERRSRRRQPHSQPHKPEQTGPDETAQPSPPDAPDRTIPAHPEPEATGGRHS